jgi:hypothetical protein
LLWQENEKRLLISRSRVRIPAGSPVLSTRYESHALLGIRQRRRLTETGEIEIGDAQLVWRGKDTQDWSDLIVRTPALYIQEKIHPKAIIDDLRRRSAEAEDASAETPDLFADFNGVPKDAAAEFYQHKAHLSNRMILGDSLAVMASLAERERLKGKVQCVYFDPPYGIRFNQNWHVSTRFPEVEGRQVDISREPEQVKAFATPGRTLLLDLLARPPDGRPRTADRQWFDLRPDRRRARTPCTSCDGRGVWNKKSYQYDFSSKV